MGWVPYPAHMVPHFVGTILHAHTHYIMHHPKGGAYGCPLGHPLEPGARRADERQKEIVATYNGHPKGVPICMPPVGACINGLGALPSPYGPTLRGDHNALRASKNKNNM